MDTEQLEEDGQIELSNRSYLNEHHMRIDKLERRIAYLQAEIDGMEARRRARQRDTMVLLFGVCYGLIIGWILLS